MAGSYKTFRQSRNVDGILPIVRRAGGNLAPASLPLAPFGTIFDQRQLAQFQAYLTADMDPEDARRIPTAQFTPGDYADMQQLQVSLADGVDSLVLSRPRSTRIFLLIYNPNAASLYFAWDQIAGTSSVPIPSGGNLLLDSKVPQNDLHLYYTGASVNVPIQYMNLDIANATS